MCLQLHLFQRILNTFLKFREGERGSGGTHIHTWNNIFHDVIISPIAKWHKRSVSLFREYTFIQEYEKKKKREKAKHHHSKYQLEGQSTHPPQLIRLSLFSLTATCSVTVHFPCHFLFLSCLTCICCASLHFSFHPSVSMVSVL